MKILAIGDVTSPGGVAHLEKNLWVQRRKYGIDFCIVNGENASFITGISRDGADVLLRSGADAITGGNHTMQNYSALKMLDETNEVIRPLNYGEDAPGRGYTIIDTGAYRVLVMNAMGNVHIEPQLDAPYSYIEAVLRREAGKYDIAVLDVHAEATGEKLAIAHEFDDETLTSRDTINAKLRNVLDEATNKWGVKVNRVELQDITPPSTVRDAMEQQMQAERERRAKILRAEGEKQSAILSSEGEKQSQINYAAAEKEAQILKAQGEAEAKAFPSLSLAFHFSSFFHYL